eukprot:1161146-Pelagomonas_calceolata.AAC.1
MKQSVRLNHCHLNRISNGPWKFRKIQKQVPGPVGSHREEGGPCWDVGEHAWGLGVGLKLVGQGLPDSCVVGPM